MSKVTKTLFGGSDSRQSSDARFHVKNTPYSSLQGETLNLDPSIRSLQEETLGGIRSLIPQGGDVISSLRSTRESLSGNLNPFVQARVSPLEASIASRRGQLQQSLGLRGLGGSSFGEQAMNTFVNDSERALGDARALATNDALNAITGVDQSTMNAIGALASLYGIPADVAQRRLQQELESLGLGKSQASEWTASGRGGVFGQSRLFGKPIF